MTIMASAGQITKDLTGKMSRAKINNLKTSASRFRAVGAFNTSDDLLGARSIMKNTINENTIMKITIKLVIDTPRAIINEEPSISTPEILFLRSFQ